MEEKEIMTVNNLKKLIMLQDQMAQYMNTDCRKIAKVFGGSNTEFFYGGYMLVLNTDGTIKYISISEYYK